MFGWRSAGHIFLPSQNLTFMEITKEKSQQQAAVIEMIKAMVFQLDPEYLAECVKKMNSDASMYDAAAALNIQYSPTRSKYMNACANQLKSLVDFIQLGKEVDELRQKENELKIMTNHLSSFFENY